MAQPPAHQAYPEEPAIDAGPLPDPFRPPGAAQRIAAPDEWPSAAAAWRDLIVDLEYGGMPPPPEAVEIELHHDNVRRTWPGQPRYRGYKIHCRLPSGSFTLGAKLLLPAAEQPVPVILNGDACWPRKPEILQQVLAAGYALLLFDRTEAARDLPDRAQREERAGGLYDRFPDHGFGALSAWAWAYHRCVDLVEQIPELDPQRIAVSGHSRGGKTCLLAGVTDPRIGLINDNAGCAGGGATFRYVNHGGETIRISEVFPDWFAPSLRDYIDREAELPFDQHCLVAALAPRPVLLSYATDDRWSNPEGMVQCAWATREVYRFLGVEDRLAFHLRPGTHAHDEVDWAALLGFADHHWRGTQRPEQLDQHPYPHLRPAFDWSAPA